MIAAAICKSEEIGVLETVCVVDEGGYPLALERMDRAQGYWTSNRLEQGFYRRRAQARDRSVQPNAERSGAPGNEAFGIQWSFEGKFAIFVGGFPIVVDNEVVGGIGLSGGNGEQSTACGVAALQALQELLASSKHHVLVHADIKM